MADDVTLGQYAETWLRQQRLSLRPATCRNYEVLLRLHILPSLGSQQRVASVTRMDIRTMLIACRHVLAPGTTRLALAVIGGLLNAAREDELIPANPAAGLGRVMKLRDAGAETVKAMTMLELARFLEAAERLVPSLFPLFLVLARAGLRLGEALALQWPRLDFAERQLHIVASWAHGQLGPTKGGKPREVDMSQQLVACLTMLDHRTGWVFPNPQTQEPWSRNHVARVMHGVCRAVGLPHGFSPHSLRHTFTSLLLQRGVAVEYVSRQLGHGSFDMTCRVYGRWLPHRNLSAVDSLDRPDGQYVPPPLSASTPPPVCNGSTTPPAEDSDDTGARVRRLRLRLGLTQRALARRLGVSHSTVELWELGCYEPAPASRAKLAALETPDHVASEEEGRHGKTGS